MKRMIFLLALPVVSLIFILPGCSSQKATSNDFPQVGLSENVMNTVFCIEELHQFGNTHKNNDIYALHLENLSSETLAFPLMSSVYLFTKEGENWVAVENTMHYPLDILLLPPIEDFRPGQVIDTSPLIPELVKPRDIRVIIIGHYKDAEDELVGAYLDFTLLP